MRSSEEQKPFKDMNVTALQTFGSGHSPGFCSTEQQRSAGTRPERMSQAGL